MFALLGTNGAGKTSTLEVAEGLAKPSGGQVRVLGKDPYADRSVVRERVGIMLQSGGLPSGLTTLETASMWAGSLSRSRPPREVLDLVGLGGRNDVMVKSLSGGERRRLDLALALMGRPEVVFLDEPTTGMDPQSRERTQDLIRALVREGCAVVLTTHYLEEAEGLADRIAIMHEGSVVVSGAADQIASAYPSTIAFRLPLGISPRDLPDIGGDIAADQERYTVKTRELQRDLTTLLGWANDRQLELNDLQARSASLEEAFLAIAKTGSAQLEESAA